MVSDVEIRFEEKYDYAAIRAVNESAFGTPAEADLIERLRQFAKPVVSLVAILRRSVVGHIMFSPVTIVEHPEKKIMGLAPMAVAPAYQRRGIGAALVREGLKRVAELDIGAVVVLGHPSYYPRFGFVPAGDFDIRCEFDAPPEAFMAIELRPGYLKNASGVAKYHQVFQE
ncbi:MAG: N-acetyltransferase [Gammaproteobacteria bacterium]|nr:N-acetyltransferase [Gammaproteobacteria bacterium]